MAIIYIPIYSQEFLKTIKVPVYYSDMHITRIDNSELNFVFQIWIGFGLFMCFLIVILLIRCIIAKIVAINKQKQNRDKLVESFKPRVILKLDSNNTSLESS